MHTGIATPAVLGRLATERDRIDAQLRDLAATRDRLDAVVTAATDPDETCRAHASTAP